MTIQRHHRQATASQSTTFRLISLIHLTRNYRLRRGMEGGRIPGGDRLHNGAWRQHGNMTTDRWEEVSIVATGSPVQQRRLPEEPGFVVVKEEDALRERGDLGAVSLLAGRGDEAILVQYLVHLFGGREFSGGVAVCCRPAAAEGVVVLTAALGAGAVPCRQRGRFIEEEEFGVEAGLHQFAVSAAKLQQAGDPPPPAMMAHDPSCRVVQRAAIAEHLAALGDSNQFAERGDTVLQGHDFLLARRVTLQAPLAQRYRMRAVDAAPTRHLQSKSGAHPGQLA
jgi:hypothetical protein